MHHIMLSRSPQPPALSNPVSFMVAFISGNVLFYSSYKIALSAYTIDLWARAVAIGYYRARQSGL